MVSINVMYAQSGVKGNTFIHGNKEMMVFKPHNFVYGGSGLMPGIVCTKRNGPTYLSFSGDAEVMSVSDAAHVDGYVKNYNIPEFTFPIGDNGRYCPVSIRAAQMFSPIMAAYFGSDPSVAVTSILLGGFEPPLPAGAPFATTALSMGVRKVSQKEYWDVNGSAPVFLTLHWSQYSGIDSLTDQMMEALRIVGWDGMQWVEIPATVEPGSTFANGKITTDLPIKPETYNVYTFGSSCDRMEAAFTGVPSDIYLCVGEQMTIDVEVDLPSQVNDAAFVLQVFDGEWKDIERSLSGTFTFVGFSPVFSAKKYRIKWPLAESCNIYSNTFTHYPYRAVALACLGNINVTLGHDCDILLTPSMLLSGADLSGFYEMKIVDNNGKTMANPLTYDVINQSVMVTVVEKCSGNSCWTQVHVEDKIKPIVDCGEVQHFDCFALDIVQAEKPNEILSGINSISSPPMVLDNCNNAIASFQDRVESGACASAVIFRNWKFTDLSGNSATCTQELRFTPMNMDQLKAPQKEITLSCGQSILPEDIANYFDIENTEDISSTTFIENHEGYEKAYFTYLLTGNDGIEHAQKVGLNICNIYTSYSDQTLPLCNQGCGGSYKIIRTWILYDECSQATTSYTQLIKVMDQNGPEFIIADQILVVNGANCMATGPLAKPFDLSDDCTETDLIEWRVNLPVGASLQGDYPDFNITGLTVGQHILQYVVSDCCGNETIKEASITVNDSQPTAYCQPLTVMWDPAKPKITEFCAKDFNIGSTDICTSASDLIYIYDGVLPLADSMRWEHYFTKNNLGQTVSANVSAYFSGKAYRWQPARKSVGKIFDQMGQYPINMVVYDQSGLYDDCQTYLHIIDASQMITISGNIATDKQNPVANTVIKIEAQHPDFPQYYTTKTNGQYQFTVPVGIDYAISATKNGDYLNGVSTLDLVLIQRHILGLQSHDTPYKVIASDGTDNSKISATDLTEIRKLILGVSPTLTNQSWRFPVVGQNLDLKAPFPFGERYMLEAPLVSQKDINFTAVKIGDVDGSVTNDVNQPNVFARKSPDKIIFGYQNKIVRKGELVQIPIKSTDVKDIFGFQGTWSLKNAMFVSIDGNVIDLTNANLGMISDSMVTMSIALLESQSYDEGAVLFTLNIKALQDGFVSDMLSLGSSVTPAEVYFKDLKQGALKLNQMTEDITITLMQNEPNPFTYRTILSFEAQQAMPLSLRIIDASGKLYLHKMINTQIGLNTIELTNADLPESGIYFYTLEGKDFKETRKMLKLE